MNANLLEMQRVVDEAKLKVKQSLPMLVPLPSTVGSSFASASTFYGTTPKKRKGVSGAIEKTFNIGAREQLDGEIARMLYKGGLSFHVARNPHYVNTFKSACSVPIPGYLPPGSDSMIDRGFLSPQRWWGIHGSSTPTLQGIAFKLLGQPCSFSCCEKNWSTYNFIHFMKRNKIKPQRAEVLVFVHTNLHLLSRRTSTYNEGVSQLWDVIGDVFDFMDMENAGVLKIADLSLDEPQLEVVLFSSDR
ncbi:hypothetical protein Dsin_008476 [Dipteronia sinensis]|uniref:HAT C-terminal dimerisation domain-containing protein n=1 Tax=Dipteronia sinensis TaxID=43782 RepID=A0AAE0EAU3_9ROSI|nr:hypothetical protein Dsin_008476 [Dipteronia sinensis]